MPHLFVVRHGQPDFAGNYDSLTALGVQQSHWLGEHFAARGLRFARVASGTLQRQVDTCKALLAELPGAPAPTADARFNEYDHASLLGFFEGDRMQGVRTGGDRRSYFVALRHALQAWSLYEGEVTDGETWAGFGARIAYGLADLCDGLDRDDNVLVVSSGGVIGRYTADVLGAGAEAAIQLNLQTRNTGVSEFARTSRGTRLVAFNAIAHLEHAARAQAVTYS